MTETLDLKGKLEVQVGDGWHKAAYVTMHEDVICVKACNHLHLVREESLRNVCEPRDAGKIYNHVRATAFKLQEDDSASGVRFLELAIEEGLVLPLK